MRRTIKCVAVDCPNSTDREYSKDISFHSFPLDPIQKAEWVAAVNRKEWKPSTQSILCSEHFRPEDLDRTSPDVRVRNNAIPSIFPVGKIKPSSQKKNQRTIRNPPTVVREYESSSEDSLELEVFSEELSVAQMNFRNKPQNELEELNKKIGILCNQPNVEVISAKELTSNIPGVLKRKRKR